MQAEDWFDVGWDAYQEGRGRAELLPPPNDMEAQRWWLGGFGAAWACGLEDLASVDEALVRALGGRGDLLRQLRSHRTGWAVRTVQ